MEPLAARPEVRRRAADAEPEMVAPALSYHALADDAVAGSKILDVGTDFHDLAGPLMTGRYRVLEGDDVSPLEELEVGMASPTT